MSQDLIHLFSPKRLELQKGQLEKEPVYLLPLLFQGLILTTNFDATLEAVFETHGKSFQSVFHPGHHELLRQSLQHYDSNFLFKLHGAIMGDLTEYGNIVFTEQQYDLHYGKNSPLVQELRQCFVQKPILFLGCSLEQDKTMEVLESILEPGIKHYAILNCPKKNRDQRIRELGHRQIRVILYEDGRHEAVRVILEHLLADLNPLLYQKLSYHADSQTPILAEYENHAQLDSSGTYKESPHAPIGTKRKNIYYIDCGYAMPWQCDSYKKSIILHNPYILQVSNAMENKSYVVNIIRQVLQQKNRSLLIIANGYCGKGVLGSYFNLLMQKCKLPISAIKTPGYGDNAHNRMGDIDIYGGTEIIRNMRNANQVFLLSLSQLGYAQSAEVFGTYTILREGAGSEDAVNARILELRKDASLICNSHDREQVLRRIDCLLGIVNLPVFGKNSDSDSNSELEWSEELNKTFKQLEDLVSQGDTDAGVNLGLYSLWYRGDSLQAEKWLKDMANQGNLEAQMFLAIFYSYGTQHWSLINKVEAKKWIHMALEQHDCPMAEFFLQLLENETKM